MTHDTTGSPQNACTPAKVKALAEQGHGRNEIARRLGVSTYRVNKAAQAAGVTFDRKATRTATLARMIDAQAERMEIAEQFRQVATTILHGVINSAEELTPVDIRELMWTAGSAAATDIKYGRLFLEYEIRDVNDGQENEAAEKFATLLNTLRDGFRTIDDEPLGELEQQVAADDAAHLNPGGEEPP